MSFSQDPRMYVANRLIDKGFALPEQYVLMLSKAQPNRTIDDLRPWMLDHDPQSAIGFCSEAVGRDVLPFAQAIGQDLMACFVVEQPARLSILVINPWSTDKSTVVQAEMSSFDDWLTYAKQISQETLAREHDED